EKSMEHPVKKWVVADTPEGRAALAAGDKSLALFDPADHPVFAPYEWNRNPGASNCMAYALDAKGEHIQPGTVRGGTSRLVEQFGKRALGQDFSDFKAAVCE